MLTETAKALAKPAAVAPVEANNSFANDIRKGLTAPQKFLLPKYFYNELGSQLFEAICQLPEYYPTRCEAEILRRYAGEIIRNLPKPVSLVELGSGSSVKTRYIIEALLASQGHLLYQPTDISATILEQSGKLLRQAYPSLEIAAQARDYTQGLGTLLRPAKGSLLVLFLGSNIGNYDTPQAQQLLVQIHNSLTSGDRLLLGADLKKSPAVLEPAYNDALGVTAAFNLNLLLRINQEFGADFALNQFSHRAVYNPLLGRVESYLVSKIAQTVTIQGLNLRISFQPQEAIHTESSWKFDLNQLARLAEESGFAPEGVWLDSEEKFSCNLWRVPLQAKKQ